jgi:hypothetical protein
MNRSDESRQVRPGLGRISRPNRDDDGDEDDVTTADSSHDAGAETDDDEAGDLKNESATQGERPGSGYQGEDAEEASESRQKAGNMGTRGMGNADDHIQGNEVSEAEEAENPSGKARHGRGEPPSGDKASISGSHQGPGGADHGSPRHFTNMGHGEREATISGAHQGQHDDHNQGGMAGEGFEAGGSLRKEQARGPSGTKR